MTAPREGGGIAADPGGAREPDLAHEATKGGSPLPTVSVRVIRRSRRPPVRDARRLHLYPAISSQTHRQAAGWISARCGMRRGSPSSVPGPRDPMRKSTLGLVCVAARRRMRGREGRTSTASFTSLFPTLHHAKAGLCGYVLASPRLSYLIFILYYKID